MNFPISKTQRGAVLIVGLVMLLLLTIIGMVAIRGSTLQERMAGNMRDRNVAFQSAEAGLRAAETALNGASLPAFDGVGYGNPVASPGDVAFWEGSGFDWSTQSLQPAMGITNVHDQPQYYVEQVKVTVGNDAGAGVDLSSVINNGPGAVYRITSRAEGGSADTIVILQSTYKRGD